VRQGDGGIEVPRDLKSRGTLYRDLKSRGTLNRDLKSRGTLNWDLKSRGTLYLHSKKLSPPSIPPPRREAKIPISRIECSPKTSI